VQNELNGLDLMLQIHNRVTKQATNLKLPLRVFTNPQSY